jgi:hypothetical protein
VERNCRCLSRFLLKGLRCCRACRDLGSGAPDQQHRELIINYFRAQKVDFQRRRRSLELALYHSLGKLPEPESTHAF